MSQIKSCVYLIEFKDGKEDMMNKLMLETAIDNSFNNICKIIKRYRLQDDSKKMFYMTLFSEEESISADDYIKHYRNLPKEKYGAKVLDEFDIEIINMFN
jgi:hypothetical protein